MQVIYKYPLPIDDEVELELPIGARVLTAQAQGETSPMVWALVDSDQREKSVQKFCIRGTGHGFKGNEGDYIATFQMMHGALVWHLFGSKSND